VAGACATKPSPAAVVGLKCENRESFLGADTKSPTFGWRLESAERNQAQAAFRVQVGRSAAGLASGAALVWDSGKVGSPVSAFIKYAGQELEPGTEYFWRVRAWDAAGRRTSWSAPASFITGLARPDDWAGARWIGYEKLADSLKLVPGVHGKGDNLGDVAKRRPVVPLLRKGFEARGEPAGALVFVSGLGQYELSVNGRRVGDAFLSPGWTDYRKTCLYNTYDVTSLLNRGRNVLGLIVANGFFNINRERYRKLVIAYGMPMAILKLDILYQSGEREAVVSDGSWRAAAAPVTYSSIYGGEDYDARLEQPGWDTPSFDDSRWPAAVAVAGPGGRLRPEADYPLKRTEEIGVRIITQPKPGTSVYDFGQNASGIIRLRVRGRAGQTVRIVPGELLGIDGLVNQRASGEPYFWTYTLKGKGEESWSPRFTYYGFRYAQVEGAVPAGSAGANPSRSGEAQLADLALVHTRNSAPEVGAFECSNELFNRIYRLILWAIKSNLASVPTDCPHREKLGWLEQTHLMGASIQYNFDIHNLYDKLVDDMIEAQLESGLVPDIAPEYVPFEGGFRDSPEWGSASVILPWLIYRWYGDRSTMERAYPMMTKYAAYLGGKAKSGLLAEGLGDWCDLGPEPPGYSQLTPLGLTATAIYYEDLTLLARMAGLLGKPDEARNYERLAAQVKSAFNQEYFHADSLSYATGSQTSLAMPLSIGLVAEKDRRGVFDTLVRSIRQGGNALTAGDVGFHYLVKALADGGASQLIYEMNNRSDVPGYGYQLARGATALTESWPAREDVSNNHMMLGHIMEWLYSGLAGIRQAEDSAGFRKLVIAPNPVGDITWARARYRSPNGDISCSWKAEGSSFTLDLDVPAGSRARVLLPASPGCTILEGGRPAAERKDIKSLGRAEGRAVLELGSGNYRLESIG
jgi:alpha-L-rhamnosidase